MEIWESSIEGIEGHYNERERAKPTSELKWELQTKPTQHSLTVFLVEVWSLKDAEEVMIHCGIYPRMSANSCFLYRWFRTSRRVDLNDITYNKKPS